jgi:DNA polymerase-3 subunit epsilon
MLKSLLGNADRLVVLDVETTGLYNSDRVLEVAAVTLDCNGDTIDEWETLVDPERDVGPVHIHHITASMVSSAPRFSDIAGALARRIDGAVIAAHNLPFDVRMITNELGRLRGTSFNPGTGLCTLRMTSRKLVDACKEYQIEHVSHRALGDARACASLVKQAQSGAPTRPALASCPGFPVASRTQRRDQFPGHDIAMPYVARLATHLHHFGEHGEALAYLDMLDWALADLVLTADEAKELQLLATDLGLSEEDLSDLHIRYFAELAAAAMRDSVVTEDEHALLEGVARALKISPAVVSGLIATWTREAGQAAFKLRRGTRVCFTGAATYPDGTELRRSELHAFAQHLGLEAVERVSQKQCDLVVAADPISQSGKAKTARNMGIPIAALADFLHAQPDGNLPIAAS